MRVSKYSTVTRIAFLTGPVPVTVDPRKDDDDDNDDEDHDNVRHDHDTNPPKQAYPEVHHTSAQADLNPKHTTPQQHPKQAETLNTATPPGVAGGTPQPTQTRKD